MTRDWRTTLVECEDCGWAGTIADCVHTYKGIPLTEDVAGIDKCPKCDSINLQIIDGVLVA